ncbi:MAG: FMN-binding protein [Clostridia bacterium]|nr:FMN-binding protein [Clostridia bacterium]
MDWKETGRKAKPFAPIISVALVTVCVAGSLNSYSAPTYAAQEKPVLEKVAETTPVIENMNTDETKEVPKGSFDLEDGIYQGTGTGFAGSITVEVTIQDKQITGIDIISTSDDAAFFNRAKAVIDKIIVGQTIEVDAVTGATYSSNGIINAVKNALTGEKDNAETGSSQAGGGAAAGSTTTLAAVADAAAYKDGTYYGTGTGFGGTLKVKVDIAGGKISAIQITEHSDGSTYIQNASSLINTILSTQSTNVDTVSGATYSSVGIIQAVRNALSQAAVDQTGSNGSGGSGENNTASDENITNDETTITGTIPYVNGIYYGTAEGYSGDITVAVAIQDHTIKTIIVTKSEDDEAFFNRAMSVVDQVMKKQTTQVDTVSGATYSSKGLLGAIENALKEAQKATNGESAEPAKPDTAILSQLITEAENLLQEEYTEISWNTMQIRLADGKTALEGATQGTATQDAVDKAVTNLRAALNGLVKINQGEEAETIYIDGTYSASVVCVPDEEEDFLPYNLSLMLTVQNDWITAVTDVKGDGDPSNDTYIRRAAEGTSSRAGVVSQILNSGTLEGIDTVSRATCSSKSVIEACRAALENARRIKNTGVE